MKNYKRNMLTSLLGFVLGLQVETIAFADESRNIVLASVHKQNFTNLYYETPESDWGWWAKSDWQDYLRTNLSEKKHKMLVKAASYGYAEAQYVLGMIYSNEEKTDEATYWLGKAAEQGHASAEFTYNYYVNATDDFGIGC